MPCPVTVRSGITSKNYEDVIGELKIDEDVIGKLKIDEDVICKLKIGEDVIGKLKIGCSSREEKNYEDVIADLNKGIRDAGSTADIRMLWPWSALVCLGLL